MRTDRERLIANTRKKLKMRGIPIRVALTRSTVERRATQVRREAAAPQDAWTCYCGASGDGGTKGYWAHECVGLRYKRRAASQSVMFTFEARLARDVERDRKARDDDRLPTRRV